MGQRITQQILSCSDCGTTPKDGEYLWDMSSQGTLCESCVDGNDDVPDRECPYCGQESCDCDML